MSIAAQKKQKVLIASLTGSTIEWFDYFLYGTAAALVFNKLFFPMVDPVIGLMLSWLSFSLTFFIRPVGGVLFVHIGDRIGRKKTLVITLSLMGGATVMIGLLPTYQTIGIAAPILLIMLRVIQGMGQRPAGLRICAGKTEGIFRQYSAGGCDHWHAYGNGQRFADGAVQRGAVFIMRLAYSVFDEFGAGISRLVDS